MSLKDFPENALSSLSFRDWCTAAWNEAVSGILTGQSRVLSTTNGIWTVACNRVEDLAMLAQNDEIIYRLWELDSLRHLPDLRRIFAVPSNVTSGQARLHPALYRAFSHMPEDHIEPLLSASTLTMLRQISLEHMPLFLWQKLAWRLAAGPQISENTELLRVSRGIWSIDCHREYEAELRAQNDSIVRMLKYLSRYRPLDVVRIEIHV